MPNTQNPGTKGPEGTLESRTLEELQDEASRMGISDFGTMNKSDLIKALQTHRQNVK